MEREIEVQFAVEKIAQLGQDATKIDVQTFAPPDACAGLPTNVSFGFNHQSGHTVDLRDIAEKWRVHPERRKGSANVSTLQSFIDLTNRHKTGHSVLFAATSWPKPSITAVLDYHEKDSGKPQFGQHRIHYPCPVTEEFAAWMAQDGKAMSQQDFAAFVENRIAEIATPSRDEEAEYADLFQTKFAAPGDMMMLSRGLEIHVASAVKAHHTLSSGEREIVFTEEHDTKIVVPGLFMVSVPAFLDAVPVRLPARLRYRVAGGSVAWFFQLYRWKELLRAAVVADLERVTSDTELPAYEGSPEMSGS